MSTEQAHIVVVDDDREIRASLRDYLRLRGFRASIAADSRELDRLLATANPDLIVLDIMMPGEDGLSACRKPRRCRSSCSPR
jgi:two-component system OmpR family response regulator